MRITVRNLTKKFGQMAVVNGVTLTVEEGELFTLLGPSGCGKTTLLRLIAGFYAPDEGDVLFNDRRVNDVPPHERHIGMVFQNYALWPHMTVWDNVAYGLKLRNVLQADINERVQGVLSKVKLDGFEQRYPGQLSGGQQQRVALARALVLNPDILLLDEPLSNLDAKVRIQVRAEIRKLQKELGITTIYVTHDQEEALTLSDRIAVFNQGKVFQVGPPKELYERPTSRFVADFIGINNLLDGTVLPAVAGSERTHVTTALGEIAGLRNANLNPGDSCVICVRPENAHVNDDNVQSSGPANVLSGKVAFAAYLGNTLRYDVDLGSGITFKADVRDPWHHQTLPLGAPIEVSFPVSSTLVIPANSP